MPELAALARRAVRASRPSLRCADTEIVTADVSDFGDFDDVTVAYLYDPVRGETLERVIAKLVESRKSSNRPLRVIYHHPSESARFERTGRFRLARFGRRRLMRWRRTSELVVYEFQGAACAGASEIDGLDQDGTMPPLSRRPRTRRHRNLPSPHFRASDSPDLQLRSNAGSTGRGEVAVADQARRAVLRRQFATWQAIRLRAFLDAGLLDRVQTAITNGAASATAQLLFMINAPEVFAAVDEVTGMGPVVRFDGALREVPSSARQPHWGGNLIGQFASLRINVSRPGSRDGSLAIRDRDSRAIYPQEDELAPGDALLFRRAPYLQELEPVPKQGLPRVLFEGRFRAGGSATPLLGPIGTVG